MTATLPAKKVRTGLTHDEVRAILPHRWPMLLLDRVDEVEPGKRAVATKNVAGTELWFQGHFPDQAVLPGVVMIEALAQLSGVVSALEGGADETKIIYLAGVRSIRFRRPVLPGDRLVLTAERTAGGGGISEYKVSAKVDGQVAAEGALSIADPAHGKA
ncbi:3-hydroxyacyl-ACP dehydratase FabZ [Pseudonocardia nematodicida]|uniref:3-hydroxyacyl-ACP dehydratase FabZ n=1 Tax=Pseudonocardia nematodicida TaxID=1206997 RepID=A0ABV1K6S0_9PSEU